MSRVLKAAAVVVLASAFLTEASRASAGEGNVAIDSPLARSTASTTTETRPYQPTVRIPGGLTVLYSGSRGSKIEPCGCRALNLGGIDKEAAIVSSIRKATSATLYLDAGGLFRLSLDSNMRLESWYLVQALKQLGIQAINVSYWDLKIGIGGLKELESSESLPLVSANIIDTNTKKPVFAPYRDFEIQTASGSLKVAVVGVTAPDHDVSFRISDASGPAVNRAVASTSPGEDIRMRWMIPIAEHQSHILSETDIESAEPEGRGGASPASAAGGTMSPGLKFALQTNAGDKDVSPYQVSDEVASVRDLAMSLRANHDILILLAFDTPLRARRIAQELPMFDMVVSGDYSGRVEPVKTGLRPTLVVSGDHDGKYLGRVDIRTDNAGKIAEMAPDLIPIVQSIQPVPEYTRFIDSYSADTAKLPVPKSQQIAKQVYAGEFSCRQCHIPEFTQWKTTKHSHAMKTLIDKKMQFNTDCLKCHTVAYGQPGGFRDLRVTAQLANVQCEVCHGPSQAHVEEERHIAQLASEKKPVPARQVQLRMKWDRNFCMQCHNPQNDPIFDFDKDVQRIRHQNPAADRVRPTTAPLDM